LPKTDICIMRMFNVYGPGQDLKNLKQGMVSIYLAQAFKKGDIIVKGSFDRFRDFIYIDDVVQAWINALNKDLKGFNIFNIGSGKKIYVKELLSIIQNNFYSITISNLPATPGDQIGIYSNNKKMKRLLNIKKLVSLSEGIKKYSNEIKKTS